ncbi:cytochrome P450 [Apodospora peruviana]|uniref:Cytochrome P450 n=1 Tax=Apodospora peruviana TaxID=516989 RepID=A0AAE0I2F6_9PEZI|nr:cytochrome P450 [Apodospora peruviana]
MLYFEPPGHGALAAGILVSSCLCLVVAAYIQFLPPHKRGNIFFGRGRYNLPPGPADQPLVGSLLPWLRARNGGQWVPWLVEQARYGDMTTLHMGTKTWVLLNNSRAVNEIISRRAAIVHERPYMPIAGGLVSQNRRFFLLKTADWRVGRRLVGHLQLGATKDHEQIIDEASLGLLCAFLDSSKLWYRHIYRYPMAIMHKVITGRPLLKTTAELQDLQRVTSTFLTSINSHLVDFFPQLERIVPRPLQFWRRRWEEMGRFHYRVMSRWWDGLTSLIADDENEASFVRHALHGYAGTAEERAMYLTMLLMSAGADNPRMTMNAWVMACISYPEVMQRVRGDLDRLCGSGDGGLRLPSLDDLPQMSYLCAVIKEVLRWRPTVPLMPQRVLVEDMDLEWDDGKIYRFPAGTEFLVNSIPVCTNGYDRPDEFRPERWLDRESGHGMEQDLWQFAFSGGKRYCVGYKLAQKELFVAFARLLYCFDFSFAGGDGEKVDDTKLNAFEPGEPFPVKVSVRSRAHEKLIRNRAGECRNWGPDEKEDVIR